MVKREYFLESRIFSSKKLYNRLYPVIVVTVVRKRTKKTEKEAKRRISIFSFTHT